MVAVFVLIAGVLLTMVVGGAVLMLMGMTQVLASLVPLGPWLVMVGTSLLILTELLMFLGGREDRRVALRDLGYMLPTLIVSGGLWYVAQHFLW